MHRTGNLMYKFVTLNSGIRKMSNLFYITNAFKLLCLGCDYQADVCWEISNTIKQTSVGKCQIGPLSSRCLLVNLKQTYYEADDVNLGFESELKFLCNG